MSLGGVLTSVLLHVCLLAPVLIGGSPPKHRAPLQTFGSIGSADEQSALTAVLIEEPEPGITPASPAEGVLLQPVAAPHVPLPTDIGELEDSKEAEGVSVEASQGGAGHSMMVGRYLGQIDARIERAWIKPRDPIASGMFACQVRIVQETDGGIQEIELVQCNGDTAWQRSLVSAIQSASPLPAPPTPEVFSRKLILEFHSAPFLPGADPEGFEPKPRTAMN